jgi:TPR repeat protein
MELLPEALDGLMISISGFELGERVAQTPISSIVRARNRVTNEFVFLKIFASDFTDVQLRTKFIPGVETMALLQHPAVIRLRGFSLSDPPFIATEFMVGGTLSNLMLLEHQGRSPDRWNNTTKFIVLFGVAAGMMYAHRSSLIHRQLSPMNIFLDSNFGPHIGDLGFREKLTGETVWMAPELIPGHAEVTSKVDVFSYGVILYQMLTGRLEFSGRMAAGDRPDIPFGIPAVFSNLITKCWDAQPDVRPSFDEIVHHLMTMNLTLFGIDAAIYDEYKNRVLQVMQPVVPGGPENEPEKRIATGDVYAMHEYAQQLFEAGRDAEAVKYLVAAANGGNVDAALQAAEVFDEGRIVGQNDIQSARFWKMAGHAGNVEAQFHCGRLLEAGIGIQENRELAQACYRRAAAQGHEQAIKALAKGFPDSIPFLGQLAANGNLEAALQAAAFHELHNDPQAITMLEIAGNLGEVSAFFHCGRLLENGIGDVKNPERAIHYYQRAAELGFEKAREKLSKVEIPPELFELKSRADAGDVGACYQLGCLIAKGEHLSERDYLLSAHYLKPAALGGITDAQFRCASYLQQGLGVAQNHHKAAYFYKLAGDAGHTESLFAFAHLLAQGQGVPQDLSKANEFLRAAADRGHLQSQLAYAFNLERGIGVECDMARTLHYLTLAADQGSALALNQCGVRAQGASDFATAADYYRRAAALDDATGQFNYGVMLQNGHGIAKNIPEALKMFRAAADKGNVDAQCNYAILLSAGGRAPPKDMLAAKQYAKFAADANHPTGQCLYAQLLILIDRNQTEAIEYFKLAAAQGNQRAIRNLAEMGIGLEK